MQSKHVLIKNNLKRFGQKYCLNCGGKISPESEGYTHKLYCCRDCKVKKRTENIRLNCRKYYKTKIVIVKCVFCNGDFETESSTMRRYCSKECQKNQYKKKRENSAYNNRRFMILKRDNFKCVFCGRSSIEDGVTLHIDHLIPKNETGLKIEDELPERLVTSCKHCNCSKGHSILDEEVIERIIERNKGLVTHK